MNKKRLFLSIILLIAGLTRLLWLDQFPAGLNADEAAIGYNAWSLLETGRDEHGATWPLVFRSFDDYKPPLYFYLVLPFVKILGLNIWAVRLPSAFLGIASVYLVYLLANKLFEDLKVANNDLLKLRNWGGETGLIAALLLSVLPWHLHFSRGGWEVNVATFFLLLGIWAFLQAVDFYPRYYLLFVISFVLSMYTYHSMRLIAPLMGLLLLFIYGYGRVLAGKRYLAVSILVGLVLLMPLTGQMLGQEGQSRFIGVSIFADQGPLWQALELRRNYIGPPLLGRLFYNRYVFYGWQIVKNYMSHFSTQFLFVSGDEIARSRVPGVGQAYLFLAPLFWLGIIICFLKFKKVKGCKLILAWLFFSPLAAALTFQSPHALRAHNMVVPMILVMVVGVCFVLDWLAVFFNCNSRRKIYKNNFIFTVGWFLLVAGLIYSYGYYAYAYFYRYPRELPYAWEYGFDQMAEYIKQHEQEYEQIIISDRYDQPYIILAFYLKYPPERMQKEIRLMPRDRFGFSTVKQLGKFYFRTIDYEKDSELTKTLIVATEEVVPESEVIHTVFNPAGQPMFKFIKIL